MSEYERGAADAVRVANGQGRRYIMMLLREAEVCKSLVERGLSDIDADYEQGYSDKLNVLLRESCK